MYIASVHIPIPDLSPDTVTVTFDPVVGDGASTVSSGCGSYRLQHLRGSPNRYCLLMQTENVA